MLYIPMMERVEDYGWNAMNCYDWTPWLDLLVDMIESAKCIDLGLMTQEELSAYVKPVNFDDLMLDEQLYLLDIDQGQDVSPDTKVFETLKTKGLVDSDGYGLHANYHSFAIFTAEGQRLVNKKKRQIHASLGVNVTKDILEKQDTIRRWLNR